MNHKEIDRLIAEKVMGWPTEIFANIDVIEAYTEYGTLIIGEDWAPTADMTDAWLVVKELQRKEFYSTHTDLMPNSEQEWWSWHFTKGTESFSAQAESAPLAICKAALSGVGAGVPK